MSLRIVKLVMYEFMCLYHVYVMYIYTCMCSEFLYDSMSQETDLKLKWKRLNAFYTPLSAPFTGIVPWLKSNASGHGFNLYQSKWLLIEIGYRGWPLEITGWWEGPLVDFQKYFKIQRLRSDMDVLQRLKDVVLLSIKVVFKGRQSEWEKVICKCIFTFLPFGEWDLQWGCD